MLTLKRKTERIYVARHKDHKARVNRYDKTLLEVDYFKCGTYYPYANCPDGMTWKIEKKQSYFGLVFEHGEAVNVK